MMHIWATHWSDQFRPPRPAENLQDGLQDTLHQFQVYFEPLAICRTIRRIRLSLRASFHRVDRSSGFKPNTAILFPPRPEMTCTKESTSTAKKYIEAASWKAKFGKVANKRAAGVRGSQDLKL